MSTIEDQVRSALHEIAGEAQFGTAAPAARSDPAFGRS